MLEDEGEAIGGVLLDIVEFELLDLSFHVFRQPFPFKQCFLSILPDKLASFVFLGVALMLDQKFVLLVC